METSPPTGQKVWLVRVVRLLVLVGLLVLVHEVGRASLERYWDALVPSADAMGIWPLIGGALVFALFLSIPFVPGMEIGLAMMMMFGIRGVVLVYLSTLLALSVSFFLGRWVSLRRLGLVCRWLRMDRAENLVNRIAGLKKEQRIELLLSAAPGRWVPFLLRYRHLSLMVLLNVPGNALLGGGGGIGFLVGVSGLLAYPSYLASVAVAILPFPVYFFLSAWG